MHSNRASCRLQILLAVVATTFIASVTAQFDFTVSRSSDASVALRHRICNRLSGLPPGSRPNRPLPSGICGPAALPYGSAGTGLRLQSFVMSPANHVSGELQSVHEPSFTTDVLHIHAGCASSRHSTCCLIQVTQCALLLS